MKKYSFGRTVDGIYAIRIEPPMDGGEEQVFTSNANRARHFDLLTVTTNEVASLVHIKSPTIDAVRFLMESVFDPFGDGFIREEQKNTLEDMRRQ